MVFSYASELHGIDDASDPGLLSYMASYDNEASYDDDAACDIYQALARGGLRRLHDRGVLSHHGAARPRTGGC